MCETSDQLRHAVYPAILRSAGHWSQLFAAMYLGNAGCTVGTLVKQIAGNTDVSWKSKPAVLLLSTAKFSFRTAAQGLPATQTEREMLNPFHNESNDPLLSQRCR